MSDLLKRVFLGAAPDSKAWSADAKDFVASVRKMLASAFWQAATLFVVTMASGMQGYIEQHYATFGAIIGITAIIEGAVKMWGRFVKDYSGESAEKLN